ncbi:MAG TPA: dihydrofolate reductase family protein [Ktedonobacteraceae bacterium]|nr:dihydrofolate reductase family protein [Ktedonobacteraceae bacterium]
MHVFPTLNKNIRLNIQKEKNLRKIIVTTWITLDGFLAGPNGEMNWVMVDQEMGQYEDDLVSSADTLILGRVTYQSFAGSWPHVPENPSVSEGEKEYARKLNSMRKIVFSKSLEKAEWNNSQLVREILPNEIASMKQMPGKDIVIYGSASIVQAFTDLGLIDEYQLLVHPVVLGGGKPLFAGIAKPAQLNLLHTKSFPSGVIGLYYVPQSK